MRFNLDNLNPPTWFEHPEDEEARVCLRVASGEDMNQIVKETTTKRFEWRRGTRQEIEDVDEDKRSDLTWQACIVDWEGLYDNEDNPIPCTDENKIKLMLGSPPFSRWIVECLDKLTDNHQQTQESAEKN